MAARSDVNLRRMRIGIGKPVLIFLKVPMRVIMPMDEPRLRGTVIRRQISGPPFERGRAFQTLPAAMSTCAIAFASTIIKGRCRIRRAMGRSRAMGVCMPHSDQPRAIMTASWKPKLRKMRGIRRTRSLLGS
jgi:hypothetical protein